MKISISDVASKAFNTYKQHWKKYLPLTVISIVVVVLVGLIPVAGQIAIQPLVMIYGAIVIAYTTMATSDSRSNIAVGDSVALVRLRLGQIIPLALLFLALGLLLSLILVIPVIGVIIGIPLHLLLSAVAVLSICHLLNESATIGQLWDKSITSLKVIGIWKAMGFTFVAAIMGVSGALLFGIGVFITMPLTFIMWSLLFTELQQESVCEISE